MASTGHTGCRMLPRMAVAFLMLPASLILLGLVDWWLTDGRYRR